MRTPVGSSKISARSRSQNSPGWEPREVIFTVWARAREEMDTRRAARSSGTKCLVFNLVSGQEWLARGIRTLSGEGQVKIRASVRWVALENILIPARYRVCETSLNYHPELRLQSR